MKSNSYLISQDELNQRAEILKALGHPLRLYIVYVLAFSERSVGALVKILGTKQSHTSQQLSILKYRGIIKARRVGNVVYYSIRNLAVLKIIEAWEF